MVSHSSAISRTVLRTADCFATANRRSSGTSADIWKLVKTVVSIGSTKRRYGYATSSRTDMSSRNSSTPPSSSSRIRVPSSARSATPMWAISCAGYRGSRRLAYRLGGRAERYVARYSSVFQAVGVKAVTAGDGRNGVAHRGRGFGPVAVTRRCGTQSSTWTKPSMGIPARTSASKKPTR
jgi:hypothetical protein